MKDLPVINPDLPIVKAGWRSNPLTDDGRYRNLYEKSERSFADVLRWQTAINLQRAAKKADHWRMDTQDGNAFFSKPEDGLLWLGHATFLFRIAGKLILTDPVLGNCSLIKRRSKLPVSIEQLRGIDYILLSHNHRDHADQASLQRVLSQNPQAIVLTGLETGRRLVKSWMPAARIQEAGWWQQFDTGSSLDIIYLPAKHWARRGLSDLNDMLWGSYALRRASDGNVLFFGADSGYDVHFQEIGAAFPGIDLALIGIGAYAPRWFMQASHTDPDEAVRAAQDLQARRLMPMHYGTFDLSDEPFGEPFERISQLAITYPDLIHSPVPGGFLAF